MRFHPIFFVRSAVVVCSAFFAVSGYSVPVSPVMLALDFDWRDTVGLSQLEAAGNDIKIQHPRSGEQIRSAAQSFAWGVDEPLTGLGVQVAGATVWAADAKQDYELRIFSYDPAGKPPVAEAVTVFVFQMNASLAKPGQWLYVEFPEPLYLDTKKGHVFQFAAVSPGGSILALKSSHGAGNPYSKGIGAQINANTPTVPSAGGSWDYAFFLNSAQPTPRPDDR